MHPCDREDNGGCTQRCVKTPAQEEEDIGSAFKCKCENGFELKEDGKTCEESKYLILPSDSLVVMAIEVDRWSYVLYSIVYIESYHAYKIKDYRIFYL